MRPRRSRTSPPHLGSRERLLELLNERAAAEIRASLNGVFADRAAAPADVGRAVDALVRIGSRYRVLFIAHPGGDLRRDRRAALAPLTDAVRRGQRAGL